MRRWLLTICVLLAASVWSFANADVHAAHAPAPGTIAYATALVDDEASSIDFGIPTIARDAVDTAHAVDDEPRSIRTEGGYESEESDLEGDDDAEAAEE